MAGAPPAGTTLGAGVEGLVGGSSTAPMGVNAVGVEVDAKCTGGRGRSPVASGSTASTSAISSASASESVCATFPYLRRLCDITTMSVPLGRYSATPTSEGTTIW